MDSLIVGAVPPTIRAFITSFLFCSSEPFGLRMDSLIVSANRPTIHIDNGFVDCQRGPSKHQGFNNLFLVPLFTSEPFGLAMDSWIVRAARFTILVENGLVDRQRGPSDPPG